MEFDILSVVPEWLAPLSSIAINYPYPFIFVGLLLGGETVLLPALYLGVTGVLNTTYVVIIMLVCTIISDTFWYAFGHGALPKVMRISLKGRVQNQVDRFRGVVQGKELKILFLSKFVYGTRIAAQVLAGLHRVPFGRYFLVNVTAVLAIAGTYLLIIHVAVAFSYNVQGLYGKFIAFTTVLIVSMVALHVVSKSFIQRK